MNFVLDTNAVSEPRKTRPNPEFITWLESQEPAHLFVPTITLAESWHGLHCRPRSHAEYEGIKRFIADLPALYRGLKFDLRAAAVWGEITAKANGPLPVRDSFIGAIAVSRGYRLVTRDVAPFERMGCKVLNPWT